MDGGLTFKVLQLQLGLGFFVRRRRLFRVPYMATTTTYYLAFGFGVEQGFKVEYYYTTTDMEFPN